MKLYDRLTMYRNEIRRSKKWRTESSYDADWKRYIDLYKGKQYDKTVSGDQLMVNLVFATINTLAPSVSVNNPRFVVNARRPETSAQATITEEVLNYMWRTHRYQDEFRLAVNDWLITGHGWCKCGYKFTKPPEEKKAEDVDAPGPGDVGADLGIDDRDDIEGNVESEMYIYDDRPFIERISVFDMFVDPEARHPKEMCWVAQRIWRPLADVRVDSRYSGTARRAVSAKSWSRWDSNEGDADGRNDKASQGPKTYVEVIEYYDLKRRTVCTFSLDGSDQDESQNFLIKPAPMPYAMGHPFVMLRNYEVADNFYPLGDVCEIEPLQLELNQTRSQMMNHRKRFQRKWLYDKDAFDRDGVEALESDVDNTMIPVLTDDIARVITPLPAVITPSEFYDQSSMIINDIDRVSGVSDYQRGAAQTAIKRTATEAAMIQDSAASRAQDRLAKIESVLASLGERIIGLMQQYLTGEQAARIVTMPGKAWINYDAEFIQGQFDFEVAAGSTEPMNETFRRQSAMQLVDASMPFLEMGVADPTTLYMHILQKGFGVKDAQPFIMQQGPPPQAPGMEQMGAPAQQPALPPGAPPSGVPPGLPPDMVSGGAPMPQDLTAPPPPPDLASMDPATLMQMQGMAPQM